MDHDSAVIIDEKISVVGILLLRNEDLFIAQILSNIIEFCDRIIVADHRSTDNTAKIIQNLRTIHPKIEYHAIDHPGQSHQLINTLAGKQAWIFAVDGDEVYDPFGLRILKQRIMAGDFIDTWMILGNVMNCIELDRHSRRAQGYLAPPCRSMTKLYNFGLIEEWSGDCPERLHGGHIRFKKSLDQPRRYDLYREISWELSPFRCLHLCFIPRSSQERQKGQKLIIRKNISEQNRENVLQRLFSFFAAKMGTQTASRWKYQKYMRGELINRDAAPFFPSSEELQHSSADGSTDLTILKFNKNHTNQNNTR